MKGEFRAQFAHIDMPGGASAFLDKITEMADWRRRSLETFPAKAGNTAEIAAGILDPTSRQIATMAQLAQESLILAAIRHIPPDRHLREERYQVPFPAKGRARGAFTAAWGHGFPWKQSLLLPRNQA